MAKIGKCKVHEEDSSRTRQVPQTLVAPQQLIDEDLPFNPTLDSECLEIEGSIPLAKYKYEQAKLEAKKVSAQDQRFETDELNIYREVVGKASHGRVLGMGSDINANDVYSCREGSIKRARVDKTEELELKIKNMEEELHQYKALNEFE
ncbi:hypothetical protein JRO89_XS06G0173100 [Xanthoceras sorbifolium]|uniref:Uncharacterized protein n=1 Tax=Xanthoceras sorbifolium TaxID=99658 RepID=A0ABQ8HYQ3_9ROSI|nr:hypothetical protein JRO89_XS06G0173100 [Xanthoceras sorbifolium]